MKDIDYDINQDQVIITNQKEVNKEIKHLGRMKIYKGQKVFELDMKTAVIKQAIFDESVLTVNSEVRNKLIVKENHLYCVAINIKNAEKKFLKMIP